MHECLFCKIIAGTIPAQKVYEDERVFAFLDINPVNPGHTLVVPKAHAENLYTISDGDLGNVMSAAKRIAVAAKKVLGADGINIEMNNDPAAGQVIFHAHIHVIPRFEEDGLRHWPGKPYEDGAAAAVAEKIGAGL